jgi:hypothetical protein
MNPAQPFVGDELPFGPKTSNGFHGGFLVDQLRSLWTTRRLSSLTSSPLAQVGDVALMRHRLTGPHPRFRPRLYILTLCKWFDTGYVCRKVLCPLRSLARPKCIGRPAGHPPPRRPVPSCGTVLATAHGTRVPPQAAYDTAPTVNRSAARLRTTATMIT